MLWLCIYLPSLPLAVFERADSIDRPFVTMERGLVDTVNRSAERAGIAPGMRLTAALALQPRLHWHDRRPENEARTLKQIAAWCLQFTAQVSLQPPAAILLEIGGSLRYFGGLEALRGRVRSGLEELGYHHRCGIAPTPGAAWMLACAGDDRPVTHRHELRERLARLPAGTLVNEAGRMQALSGLGIESIADLLALPRDGLARRLGASLIGQLERAFGERPDPRRRWQPPPHHRSRVDLVFEAQSTDALVFPLKRLIGELAGYLHGIERGTQQLHFRLLHHRQSDTPFSVGLIEPSRDAAHLLELTRERIERITLPAPVTGIVLQTRDIQPLPPRATSLLPGAGMDREANTDSRLIERLGARLGTERLNGLAVHSEHRPERAWGPAPPGAARQPGTGPERPLWLLARPLLLERIENRPHWHGVLVLERGPERIESGWWDGNDIARDYYIASNEAGERLWVFQERRGQRGWYLHGLFG